MAWVRITNKTGTNTLWEYDNNPADPGVGSPLRSLWQKSAAGIRGVPYSGAHTHEVYVSCRRVDKNAIVGELSKTYYDNLDD